MKALVGYTGFVGSNIYAADCFEYAFNSKNIKDAYGLKPDLLIYCGLRAEKYLANNMPDKDEELIRNAEENIIRIAPKKLVLISTIDVFCNPVNVDEDTEIITEGLHPYGYNRYQLECWTRKNFPEALIIRLPGLFGRNIKKNFIYDYIKRIPSMLNSDVFKRLTQIDSSLDYYYNLQENGYYKCKNLSQKEETQLKSIFEKVGFSSLNFTDSRSVYQFYPLKRLWSDIQIALDHNLLLWHPATQPLSSGELYEYLCGDIFKNELPGSSVYYDYKTKYAALYGGSNGYICSKELIKSEISNFIQEELNSHE